MKAVQLIEFNKSLEEREIPIPAIGPRDVLIKIKAAGICHSDVHYRAGISKNAKLPLTLGHEVAGIIEKTGNDVSGVSVGDRVCVHYVLSCGNCKYCISGNDQFCVEGKMIGHHVNGGYAEYISVPARNAIILPDDVSFEAGATLMCASATSMYALLKGRIKPGDKIAVFGMGGLGQSAIQLAKAFGASEIYAVDINRQKLDFAEKHGAIPILAGETDVVQEIKTQSGGGVDVVLELIGLPVTQKQAVQCAGVKARVVLVGLAKQPLEIDTYREILANEVELIGSNDHLLSELPLLVNLAGKGILDVSEIVSKTVPLDADAINEVLDSLENNRGSEIRTVIVG